MAKQQQPVGKVMRRVMLGSYVCMFLTGTMRLTEGGTVRRAITVVVMVTCVALFAHWWRMPTIPDSQDRDQ